MKRSTWIFFLLLSFGMGHFSFGQSFKKCLTDELSLHVRDVHPLGLGDVVSPSNKALHEGEPEFTFVIPVVFHLMHDNGPELGVTYDQILSQIDVLNEDYGRYGNGFNTHEDGLDTKIKFCIASLDPDGNQTTGFNVVPFPGTAGLDPFVPGVDSSLKAPIIWDPLKYMNVFIVRSIAGSTAGYAYFPEEAAGTFYDGLVIDYRQLGRIGTATALGRTGSHEVGHYLGLLHPWGLTDTVCGARGDYCDDTPEVPFQFFSTAPNCFHPPSCGDSTRQIENYMDYSDDGCLNMFTFCQSQRMRNSISKYRYELVSSTNLARTGCSQVQSGAAPVNEFIVYPNPVGDVLTVFVDFDDDQPIDIEVYDFQGRMVVKKSPGGQGRGAIPIEVSKLEAGAYHVVVRMATRYMRKTIVVAR